MVDTQSAQGALQAAHIEGADILASLQRAIEDASVPEVAPAASANEFAGMNMKDVVESAIAGMRATFGEYQILRDTIARRAAEQPKDEAEDARKKANQEKIDSIMARIQGTV